MHPRRAKWRRRVRGGPPRTHVVGARGEGGAHKTSLEAVVAGHIEQLDGVGGDGQQQGDLVNLQRGGPLLGDVGDPRAHPHQAGGLQTDLGDDVDAVNGVAPPARRRHRRRLPVPHPSSPRGRRSRRGRRRRNRPAGEEGARDGPTSPDAAGAAPAGRRQSRCGWFPCSSSGRYAGPSGRRPRGRRDPHPSGARRGSGPAAGPEPLRCRRGASGEEEPRWWRWGGGRSSSSQRSSVNVDSVRRRVRRTRRRWDR